MSTLKVNNLQVGQDGTAANNYTLYQPASPDGTVRLGYGVAGSVTDILTVKNSRLGIGTDNPLHKLHLKSTAHDEPIALFETDTGIGGDVSIRLEGGGFNPAGSATANPDEIYIEFSDRTDASNSFAVGMNDDSSKLFFGYGSLGTMNNHTDMVLTSAGLVGIGTESPVRALDVRSGSSTDVVQFSNDSGNKVTFGVSATQVAMDLLASKSFRIRTGSNERLHMTSDGKIGIGHQNSGQITKELTIRPANDGGIRFVRPGASGSSVMSHLELTTTTAGSVFPSGEAYTVKYNTINNDQIFTTYRGGGTGGNISFQTGVDNGNETERLRITSDGSVGTGGLIASSGNLVVNSTIRSQNSSGNISYIGFTQYTGDTSVGSMFSYMGGDARSTGYLNFYTNDTKRLSISSSGATTMHVNSASHETFRFTTQASNEAKLIMKDAGSNEDIVLNTGGDSFFVGSGEFGIGTNTPASKLEVRKDSNDTTFTDSNTPSGISGVKIANLSPTVGCFTTLCLSVSNGSSTQNANIIAQSTSGGTSPDIHIATRNGESSITKLTIDSAGRVTTPLQPLSIIGTSQNNHTPSTGSVIQFDYVNTNRGNHYNTSNYTFTCPVSGDYMVILRYSRNGWTGDLELAKNNSQYVRLELRETGRDSTDNADWQAWCYSFIIPCSANDTLKWKVGATYTDTASNASGILLDGYNHIYYDSVTYYLMG